MDPSERPDRDLQDPRTLDDWLRPAFEDPILVPVVVVVGLVFGTLGAGALLMAFRIGNWAAIAAVVVLVWMSQDIARREFRVRGFGLVPRIVVGLWALSGAIALGAIALGLF